MAQSNFVGRRKTSTARVYIQPGKGELLINKKKVEDFFSLDTHRELAVLPLKLTEREDAYDIKVTVRGGGITGQAEATMLGIARALDGLEPDLHSTLKSKDLLTRDDRMVERKKYGQPKARKKFQFSKR